MVTIKRVSNGYIVEVTCDNVRESVITKVFYSIKEVVTYIEGHLEDY